MNIIGIETSCDETAVAIVQNGRKILAQVVLSQEAVHRPYGGIVPELASRFHLMHINRLVDLACTRSGVAWKDIKAIAVTNGPGLMGSLLIGVMTARAYAWVHRKPLIGVNHLESHACASLLLNRVPKPPFLTLIVSGGHTSLIKVTRWGIYDIVGRTRDDAAGEAFDKVAGYVGLGYPGGPVIDTLSRSYKGKVVSFPRPLLPGSHDFSFSGLKTAVVNYWNKNGKKNRLSVIKGFQDAVVHVLVTKTIACAEDLGLKQVVVGGGVAANSSLRDCMRRQCRRRGITCFLPPRSLCTDNGAMVAAAGYLRLKYKGAAGEFSVQSDAELASWRR